MSETQWTIGADPAADLWINHPDVSRSHCLLARTIDGYTLQDSHSTNGTFRNGQRIETESVTPTDDISLARRVRMPWPDPALARRVISIGFDSHCDYQIDDKSVSGRHAELFADPNGQWILRDLDSTNGTWVGNESIRATALSPTDNFRIGMVSLTPQRVLNKVDGHGTIAGSFLTPAHWIALASLAALFGFLGLYLWNSGSPSADVDVARSDEVSQVESSKSNPAPLLEPDSSAHSITPAAANSTIDPASLELLDDDQQDSANPPKTRSLTDKQRVLQSLFVIVDSRGKNWVSIASAWAASPSILVTNGHVVESIDKNAFLVKAIHLATGNVYQVLERGYHPEYHQHQQRLAQIVTELRKLQQDLAASNDKSESATRLIEQGTAKARLAAQSLDTFDAGWLKIENGSSDITAIQMKTVPIEPSKALRLAHTYLESESAIFDPEDRVAPELISLRASQEPILDPNKRTPIRWSGLFKSAEDRWRDYHFDGCPVVSLRGRIVGMCCGFSRRNSSNKQVSTNENGQINTIDIVPYEVIDQMVQGLTKQEN